jgi:hypothetical protein
MKKAAEVLGTALREAFQKQISNTLNVSGSADYLAVSAQSDGLRKRKTAGGDQVASVNVCLPPFPHPVGFIQLDKLSGPSLQSYYM